MESHAELLQGMRGLLTVNPSCGAASSSAWPVTFGVTSSHPWGEEHQLHPPCCQDERRAFARRGPEATPIWTAACRRTLRFGLRRSGRSTTWWSFSGHGLATQAFWGWKSIPCRRRWRPAARPRQRWIDRVGAISIGRFRRRPNRHHAPRLPVFAGPAPGDGQAWRILGAVGVSVHIRDCHPGDAQSGQMHNLSVTLSDIGLAGGVSPAAAERLYQSPSMDASAVDGMQRTEEVLVGGGAGCCSYSRRRAFCRARSSGCRACWPWGAAGHGVAHSLRQHAGAAPRARSAMCGRPAPL